MGPAARAVPSDIDIYGTCALVHPHVDIFPYLLGLPVASRTSTTNTTAHTTRQLLLVRCTYGHQPPSRLVLKTSRVSSVPAPQARSTTISTSQSDHPPSCAGKTTAGPPEDPRLANNVAIGSLAVQPSVRVQESPSYNRELSTVIRATCPDLDATRRRRLVAALVAVGSLSASVLAVWQLFRCP